MSLIREGDIRVELTPHGQKSLLQNGALVEMYFELFDDDVNYQVNVYPNLIANISGDQNKLPNDNVNTRYKLKE